MIKKDELIFEEDLGDVRLEDASDEDINREYLRRTADENILKAMVVKLLSQRKVTFDEFSRKYRDYMLSIGRSAKDISSGRNNLVRAMTKKGKMTFKMFEIIIKNVMGYNLTNISMTLRDENNKILLLSIDRITF